MGKIRILAEHVANQIAAGEVVERPASVVKELAENSIDAGSARIDVEIEDGGLTSIRVADNGSGMDEEDCRTAFFRHATSKIASGKDLFQIRTLGFRGEALPSIAAVAKVECVTSDNNDGLGWHLAIEGGTVKSIRQTAAPRGTEIRVNELFFNTPARLKYMKSVQTELGHISDYLYRLALAHPQIAFRLSHNGNVLLQTLGNGDLLQVVAAIYGISVGKAMVAVREETVDYILNAFVSKPEVTRAGRSAITIIVNGRYIKNYAVTNALLRAYHTLLPLNRYPVAVLSVEMDPALIDVNVHPAKIEVRFSKEAELLDLVEKAVRQALKNQVLIPGVLAKPAKQGAIQERMAFENSWKTALSSASPSPASPSPASSSASSALSQAARRPELPRSFQENETAASQKWAEWVIKETETGLAKEADDRVAETDEAKAAGAQQYVGFPKLYPIGQMHGTYIIAQNEDGLYLIDQHAAHERINYEYYYERFGTPAQASQQLLVPMTLEFTPSEAQALREKLPLLQQAGVYMEDFGGNTFIVRAYPHWLPAGEEKSLIEEMAEWLLIEKKPVDLAQFREKSAILCSCKTSIKANENLPAREIEVLLDKLAACRNPFTCPHGRPIVVSFSTYELEKMFKRVM